MKKQIVAFMSAALIALAAPVAAHAWESPSGAVKAETITVTTESGVNVRAAAACNGTGTLKIEQAAEDVKASNAQTPEGFTEIGSFKVTCTGKVEAPYQFAYNLGAAYANAEVTIYVDHETEGVEQDRQLRRYRDLHHGCPVHPHHRGQAVCHQACHRYRCPVSADRPSRYGRCRRFRRCPRFCSRASQEGFRVAITSACN